MALNFPSICPVFKLYLIIYSLGLAKWAWSKLTNTVNSAYTFQLYNYLAQEVLLIFSICSKLHQTLDTTHIPETTHTLDTTQTPDIQQCFLNRLCLLKTTKEQDLKIPVSNSDFLWIESADPRRKEQPA